MPQEHIVKSYEQELKHLRDMIVEMGGMVESQVAAACTTERYPASGPSVRAAT